jgi:hypothetical protein
MKSTLNGRPRSPSSARFTTVRVVEGSARNVYQVAQTASVAAVSGYWPQWSRSVDRSSPARCSLESELLYGG